MSEGLSIVSYLGAAILFILCLGGLSNQETARRGNLYGVIGMTIAVLATIFGPRVGTAGLPWIIGAMPYAPGSWGPAEADRLVAPYGWILQREASETLGGQD